MFERARHSLSVRGLVLVVVLVATTACGGVSAAGPGTAYGPPASASSGGAGSSAPDGSSFVVNMTDRFRFEPATLTVPKGTTVTWKNTSQIGHTVTADPAKAINPSNVALPDGAQTWDSGAIAGGESFSRTFDVPGTYRYVCTVHESFGMVATLMVTE